MAPPLSACLIMRFLFFLRFSNASSSKFDKLLHFIGAGWFSNISVVVTFMYVSRVGDFPTGGVHPVGFWNGSRV